MKFREIMNEEKKKCIFLGGTCNGSKWRDEIINLIDKDGKLDYFNPVVDDWTEKDQIVELKERASCDYCLYVITPKMKGVYSIAEVIDDSNKRPKKTIFVHLSSYDNMKFSESEIRSLLSVSKMVKNNGGQVFTDLKLAYTYMSQGI